MKNNCIVSQIHIPPFDPQGGLSSDDKREIVDTTIKHTRANNKSAYIVLVGHGEEPYDETKAQCDHVIWEPAYPQDGGGTIINMPAQYVSVSKGIKHAVEQGFDHILKTRGDSLIGVPDITRVCHDILQREEKKILLTQQTGDTLYKFGDCFMYGQSDLIDTIWDPNVEPFHADGLRHTGANFVRHFRGSYPPNEYADNAELADGLTWNQLLRKHASFRDVHTLKLVDFRWNYHTMRGMGWEQVKQDILDGEFDYYNFLWGRTNGWHVFNREGKLISQAPICSWSYREETFYE